MFLDFIDDAPDTDPGLPANTVLVLIIILITVVATASVVSGLGRGIKWLSQTNVMIAGGVALFVGVFVARISRGRTVREFVLGLLAVPTLVTIGWFSIMGGSAIYHELFSGEDPIDIESTGSNVALFALLDTFPGGRGVIMVTIVLIALFFVTSSDSGSLVVDMLSSGGDPDPPTWSRIFWASVEGAVAIVLLLAGGLTALQTGAVSLALPFSVVMVLMVFATWKALRADHLAMQEAIRRHPQAALAAEVTESVGENVATAVAAEGAPAYLDGHEEREWTSWWQRLVDRLKSRPGGFP